MKVRRSMHAISLFGCVERSSIDQTLPILGAVAQDLLPGWEVAIRWSSGYQVVPNEGIVGAGATSSSKGKSKSATPDLLERCAKALPCLQSKVDPSNEDVVDGEDPKE